MSRVLALIGAICLIAAAVLARALLDDDDDGGGDDDGDTELVVACIPELRDACEAIERPVELTIEDPAATIERLAAGEDIDAWITLDPWPEMAEINTRIELRTTQVVATTDLVIVTRTGTPPDECSPVTWACIVESSPGRASIPEPDSASGTLLLGWAAADWAAATRPGQPFARAELDLPEFRAWLDGLEFQRDPIDDALSFGTAGPQAIGTTAVDAARISGTREEGRLVIAGPLGTPASITVVIAGPDVDGIVEDSRFTGALRDAGWTVDPTTAATGVPNAGLLVALRDTAA